MRILLVEDSMTTGELLKQNLQHAGYEVEWAATAASAITKAKVMPFDFLLCDLMLDKDQNGVQVIIGIRNLRPELNNLPALVLTAMPGLPGEHQTNVIVLHKPIKPETLVEMIELMKTKSLAIVDPSKVDAQTKQAGGQP